MIYDWSDYLVWGIFGFVSLFLLLLLVGLIAVIWQGFEEDKHCAQWDTKIVYQQAYTSFIWTGKTMVPSVGVYRYL
jgi:hypothetical protein